MNHAEEASMIISEVEEDAYAEGGSGLTLDQRLFIASIRATLAQVEAIQAQSDTQGRAASAAERMADVVQQQTALAEETA